MDKKFNNSMLFIYVLTSIRRNLYIIKIRTLYYVLTSIRRKLNFNTI